MSKLPQFHFPKDFLWGASTSAHQIEGGNHNNWSVWEFENAKSLAAQARHKLDGLDVWPDIKKVASDPSSYISGKAVDHYNLYEKDFAIAKSLGLNSFRFSVEWSRIEPEEGQWDRKEIAHYRAYIDSMKAHGLAPIMTLYHWTVPVWFAKKGGFEKKRNVKYFEKFAQKVLHAFGSDVAYINTINEPDTVSTLGYVTLEHPPQQRSWVKFVRVYYNLMYAHKRVYKIAKKMNPGWQVGFTKTYAHIQAGDDRRISRFMVWLDRHLRNDLVVHYAWRHYDYLGVNYYFSDRWLGFRISNENKRLNDLGWEMMPHKLENVLVHLGLRYKKPLLVTENGLADMHDESRQWWISHSIQAMNRAIEQGVDVRGYLHWSLLDNFEWAYGRWPRFGLVEVNYKTMKRTVRSSAKWYSRAIKSIQKGAK